MKRLATVMVTALVAAGAWLALATAGAAQVGTAFGEILSHPAIQYAERRTTDPVARLKEAIDAGRIRLDTTGPVAYLRSLLRAMDVSETSQIMVFSKTSLQRMLIGPANPRALYFNDAVSIGWVPGGIIEIASQDPEQGVQFYSVDPKVGAPTIVRRNECLQCHHSYRTDGVPGMIEPMTHRRPLEMRWGGWYVTGDLGPVRHLGNVDVEAFPRQDPTERDFNWPSLGDRIAVSNYLSPYSDVGALMLFEHQMHMMNLLTKANWDARVAEHQHSGDTAAALQEDVEAIVDYMLFVDEARLPAPIRTTSGFAEQFARLGPFDRTGRSLRQLDLRTRLLKYPCSFMIYSAQFEHLPGAVRSAIYGRLWKILSGAERAARYAHLSKVDRQAIVAILRDTKRDLPAGFAG